MTEFTPNIGIDWDELGTQIGQQVSVDNLKVLLEAIIDQTSQRKSKYQKFTWDNLELYCSKKLYENV